jgi:uncharacterized protein (DUF1697 family)
MPAFAALLRAINVSGSGKLAMSELTALCEAAGFTDVATYIQSGNVVFKTRLSEEKARTKLELALAAKLGKPTAVVLRTADELEALLSQNPFKNAPSNRVVVVFMNEAPPRAAVQALHGPDGEELSVAGKDVFIHYPNGQGRSKLKLPFAKEGTGRNMNTVTKLAAMSRALSR